MELYCTLWSKHVKIIVARKTGEAGDSLVHLQWATTSQGPLFRLIPKYLIFIWCLMSKVLQPPPKEMRVKHWMKTLSRFPSKQAVLAESTELNEMWARKRLLSVRACSASANPITRSAQGGATRPSVQSLAPPITMTDWLFWSTDLLVAILHTTLHKYTNTSPSLGPFL